MPSVGAIVVAAGRGERLGGPMPKQLLDLGGRTLLQRSVALFDQHAAVHTVVVVLPRELMGDAGTLVGPTSRPCLFVAGGDRRQDSVRLGLAAMPAAVDLVLIHDAARPFADAALVDRVIRATDETGAAVPAVPARDTVKRVRPGSAVVAETIPRDEIWLAQTPQGFRRSILSEAMTRAGGDTATDDAVLAERIGCQVSIVPGSDGNMKITTADDLAGARAALVSVPRVGTGYDLHRLVADRPLVLAGIVVPCDRGPLGHSDGDVVCHAIADAMLGAAGAGDIGRHFPDTDPRWKDAAGLDLLGRTAEIVAAAGWHTASVDVTVLLERPRLAPHIELMRRELAAVLGIAVDDVNVKAKTNEGADAVGRSEAIAAHAVAVLARGMRR